MRIIDLFSGAGGLTFGFYYKLDNDVFTRTSNEFIFANEYSSKAAKAFSLNYPDIHMENTDIKQISEEFVNSLVGEEEVDLIVGGPPCQSFSMIGKRRYDDNAKLYKEYLRILKIAKPKVFLFENVKGLLSMREVFYKTDSEGNIEYNEKVFSKNNKTVIKKTPIIVGYGDFIINKIENEFGNIDNSLGYKLYYKVLNAVDFGVPQNRERLFIIGIRNDIEYSWRWDNLTVVGNKVSLEEAISDLPSLTEGESNTRYSKSAVNDYQRLMRKGSDGITQHYCGVYGDKIQTIIKNVLPGQGKNDFNKLVDSGLIDEKYRITSGYDNTYGRLLPDKPCTTITNNLTTPSGLRCIHYQQDRALSPREGARVQSFPDWFQFYGNKEEVAHQIGNAVPPLLSLVLSRELEIAIDKINGE